MDDTLIQDQVSAVYERFSRQSQPSPTLDLPKQAEPPKVESKKEASPGAPQRKQIPLMTATTAKGIHDKVQSRRYGSYRSIVKTATVFILAVITLYHQVYLLTFLFVAMAGYFWSDYDTDHAKYRSWSKRVAVIPDIAIYDDGPAERVPFQRFRELMSVPKLPTIID